jgi:hypothetical protein
MRFCRRLHRPREELARPRATTVLLLRSCRKRLGEMWLWRFPSAIQYKFSTTFRAVILDFCTITREGSETKNKGSICFGSATSLYSFGSCEHSLSHRDRSRLGVDITKLCTYIRTWEVWQAMMYTKSCSGIWERDLRYLFKSRLTALHPTSPLQVWTTPA